MGFIAKTPAGGGWAVSTNVVRCLTWVTFVECLLSLVMLRNSVISQKPHVQISWYFLYILTVTVAWPPLMTVQYASHVLPVLWMESCLHIMAPVGQNQICYMLSSSQGGGAGLVLWVGGRPDAAFGFLPKRSIRKPDQHRKDTIQQESLGTDIL